MPRPVKSNVEQMDDEVIKCFIHPETGKEMTTRDERRAVAEHFCSGDYQFQHTIASKYGLLPIALIIAALLDIDHPLLCSPSGRLYNSMAAAIRIIQVMNKGETVAQPVETSSFHRQAVERTT